MVEDMCWEWLRLAAAVRDGRNPPRGFCFRQSWPNDRLLVEQWAHGRLHEWVIPWAVVKLPRQA